MIRTTAIALLTALACSCAGGPTAPAVEAAVPSNFDAWLATLPEAEGFTPYHTDFRMEIGMDLIAMAASMEEVQFDGGPSEMGMQMVVSGELDFRALDVARCAATVHLDMSGMGGEIPGPMEVDVLAVADGTTLWMEPNYRSDWLRRELENSGTVNMVYTVKLATLTRMLESFSEVIDAEAPGAFGDEGYLHAVRAGQDLMNWVHNLPGGYVIVEGFEVDGDEVLLDIGFREEMLDLFTEPGMPTMDIRSYQLTADRATGALRTMRMELGGPGMEIAVEATLEPRAVDGFPEGHFRFDIPDGHTVMPLDTLAELAIGMMTAGVDPSEQDYEF